MLHIQHYPVRVLGKEGPHLSKIKKPRTFADGQKLGFCFYQETKPAQAFLPVLASSDWKKWEWIRGLMSDVMGEYCGSIQTCSSPEVVAESRPASRARRPRQRAWPCGTERSPAGCCGAPQCTAQRTAERETPEILYLTERDIITE